MSCLACKNHQADQFLQFSSSWRHRRTIASLSPDRRGSVGDFFYYEPLRSYNLQSADGARMSANAMNRDVADVHPVGWDFSDFPEGWLNPEPVEGDSSGSTGDVADDDAMRDPYEGAVGTAR